MFRMQVMPEQFKLKSAKEQYKRWEQDFMSCLKGLDMKLVEHTYLCGEKLTMADIIVFNELSLFMELNSEDKGIDSAEMAVFPNLVKWFKIKMLNNQTFKMCNDEMKAELNKCRKMKPQ